MSDGQNVLVLFNEVLGANLMFWSFSSWLWVKISILFDFQFQFFAILILWKLLHFAHQICVYPKLFTRLWDHKDFLRKTESLCWIWFWINGEYSFSYKIKLYRFFDVCLRWSLQRKSFLKNIDFYLIHLT